MTDGTTGFQVAPITEDDMSKVRDILQRALDAIVGMSQLSADVDTLRKQVAQLSDDAERLRKSNAGLEESLWQARNQRQELEAKLAEATQAKATAQREAEDWQRKANAAEAQANDLHRDLDLAKRDRDEAQFRVMELEESLKTATDKLAKIAEAHATIFGVPAPAVPPPHEPSAPPPTDWQEPVKPRQYFDTYQPGSSWDDERRQYYTE